MVWIAGAPLTAAQLNLNAPQEWSTWTPTISNSAGAYGATSVALARYCRHGDTIVWALRFTITTVGTATGHARFTLPVAAMDGTLFVGSGRENAASGFMLQAILQSTTVANIFTYDNAVNMNANGRSAVLGGVYEAA